MPKFQFTAVDGRGQEKSGSVEAFNQELASTQIRSMGLFPTSLNLVGGRERVERAEPRKKAALSAGRKARRRPVVIGSVINQKGLTVFTRQLAVLIQAGLPLLRSLEVLARQEKNKAFQFVVEDLAENIRSGNTLSDGLLKHPKIFSKLYVNMVKAGEAGGVLDVVLNRLARFMEKSVRIKGKIKSAMTYPVIVMLIAVVIMSLLMTLVVPQFRSIFHDMLKGAPLPTLTQWVLNVSDAVRSHFLLTFGFLVLLILALRFFRGTPVGRRTIDWCILNLPPVGELFRKASIARFSRTFGTLVASGVPILVALQITRDTSGNAILMGAIDVVHDRVKEGESVAAPLESTRVFPAMVTSMVDVGEETGALPEMLNRIADTYEEEVDNAVESLTSIIEPIMIVALALVVGTIVIALFLPMVSIIQNLSRT